MSGSKVTAILMEGKFCLLVELHQEGSAPAVCAAGLFLGFKINKSRIRANNNLPMGAARYVPTSPEFMAVLEQRADNAADKNAAAAAKQAAAAKKKEQQPPRKKKK